jgi:hypothetical protein
MAKNDFAIIIGLQKYPGIDDPANGRMPLSGPENDAIAFRDWVIAPDGGAVPKKNVQLILSSKWKRRVSSFYKAKPTTQEIIDVFNTLHIIYNQKLQDGVEPKVGRRLYLFMSGHGILPRVPGDRNENEAGLLMANVDPKDAGNPRYHIPGAYAANWFCQNDYFDEVFLFMDCCRDIQFVPNLNSIFDLKGNSDKAKRMYAFATKWSRRAKEKPMPDEQGKVRGIFTKTLLLGLSGAAADPNPVNPNEGVITVASLKSYLHQNMKQFIDPQDIIENPKIQDADVDYAPKAQEGNDIIIKTVPLQKFPVIIRVPAGASGKLRIRNSNREIIGEPIQVDTAPAEIAVSLPRATYYATVSINNDAKESVFNVTGTEGLGKESIVEDFN